VTKTFAAIFVAGILAAVPFFYALGRPLRVDGPKTFAMDAGESAQARSNAASWDALVADLAPVVSDQRMRVQVVRFLAARISDLELAQRESEQAASRRLGVAVVTSGSTWVEAPR